MSDTPPTLETVSLDYYTLRLSRVVTLYGKHQVFSVERAIDSNTFARRPGSNSILLEELDLLKMTLDLQISQAQLEDKGGQG